MIAMSLPPQQKPNTKRTGKRITFFNDQAVAMKEASQHTEGSYYGLGGPQSEQSHSEAGAVESSNAETQHMYLNSVIFSPEKGNQSRGHYQQTMPMKWSQQDPSQQPQERPVAWPHGGGMSFGESFRKFLSTQPGFTKQVHEGMAVPQQQLSSVRVAVKQQQSSNTGGEAFRDAPKTNRGLDWEQHQQQNHQQQQAFQQGHKPGVLNPQQHVASNTGNTSVLQPFQLAFGQPKQNLGYYQVFQGNRPLPNLNYSAQTNSQHQIQNIQMQQQDHLQQQQQIQRLMLQTQQQQHQIQQQLQQQQHLHQQQQVQQQQQLLQQSQQIPHLQQQAQQLTQMQQQSQQIQQIQMQQVQPLQQQQQAQQQQSQPQQGQAQQPQVQKQHKVEPMQKLQQNQKVMDYYPSGQQPAPSQSEQSKLTEKSQDEPPSTRAKDLPTQQPPTVSQPTSEAQQLQPGPRRSRRLSKEGGGPSDNPFLVPADHQAQGSHNGAHEAGEAAAKQGIRAAPTGVIQSTRRKRRVSQEVNLETLAQKASEMESLPSHNVKEAHRPWSPSASGPGRGVREMEGVSAKRAREENLVPLVIPVSVPVQRADTASSDKDQASLSSSWPLRPNDSGRPDHKPSVIVTRRRSLRNSLSESSSQNGGSESGGDGEGKSGKSKRRPRPEPLFIPPPKQVTFIAPPIYSSITPYQSHLRSPVRLADNPLTLPPYTPPPILSPVREGSGLYFSTILSAAAAAASTQGLPPPATPKSATRSLLRSNSTEITPPVLSAMSEATPVSIEPRINIGQRYQAEIPELRERSAAKLDSHKAELVWAPVPELESKGQQQERVDDLMHLACSSVLQGGGTNQELAMHCLYECKGDIMGALALLLLKKPIFPKSHPLADYHYSGSDSWTAEERRCFNKGIASCKKDFFMVQKMVSSKTVAQCVEFYYTYKKQVKIGKNGTLLYGEAELPETRPTEEEVDYKSSQRFELRKEEEVVRRWEGSADKKKESSPARVAEPIKPTENAGAVVVLRNQGDVKREQPVFTVSRAPPAPPKPRQETPARKTGAGAKAAVAQEGEFPCKKCGRVFYKVKSRSAHMKSHAEQEKKAALLKQREAEEKAAAAAAALAASHQNGARGQQVGLRRASSEDSSDEDEDADDEDWH
ncbi:ELM2 and SANT domain-containing protein 1 [Astyanax mexicanus]|uniref:ELM2 and SANT domain-containing protein 1 n=1 Tax=Astyanax mexicanus TaxID=7994 RepID=A0A8T2L966_ASTMX|nr:ELM2 and SANT domain-containing protein 1 [Astyanax mexicanus]